VILVNILAVFVFILVLLQGYLTYRSMKKSKAKEEESKRWLAEMKSKQAVSGSASEEVWPPRPLNAPEHEYDSVLTAFIRDQGNLEQRGKREIVRIELKRVLRQHSGLRGNIVNDIVRDYCTRNCPELLIPDKPYRFFGCMLMIVVLAGIVAAVLGYILITIIIGVILAFIAIFDRLRLSLRL
jgi:hypothetical protein